ncbi:MAG: MoaD/ThiS family protein [Flavobacteriaceae bacterium]|nr:MoaD/ThiS family protein [Flavobacteriaceae bacterium]
MNVQLLFFGITADLINTSSVTIELENSLLVKDFKELLLAKFPQLKNMQSYAIAINEVYATNQDIVKENDVVAIIPPVSGG